MFYTQLSNDPQHNANIEARTIIPEIPNDGRPDFAANPWNGPVPGYAQVAARACNISPVAGCLRREITREIPTPDARVQYAHQTSIGMQPIVGRAIHRTDLRIKRRFPLFGRARSTALLRCSTSSTTKTSGRT